MVTIMAGIETPTNGNDREAAPPECRENPWPRRLSFVTMGLASLVRDIGGALLSGPPSPAPLRGRAGSCNDERLANALSALYP